MTELLENLTIHPGEAPRGATSGDLLSHVLAQVRLTGDQVFSRALAGAEPLDLEAGAAHVVIVTGGTLLIINGAGGVGSILTQIARRLTGLTVVATASRPETIAWCRKMGAHHVIDHRQPLDQELAAIGIPQVDYVAGLSGTAGHLPAILAAIAPQGRFALIDDPATLDVVPFKRKSVAVCWELMFTRPLFETPDMIEQHRLLNEVADLVDMGVLVTTLTHEGGTITAANLRTVHALLESGRSIGKAVLTGF